jgi:hypothetical protein
MAEINRFLVNCGTISLALATLGIVSGNAFMAAVFAAFAGGLYLFPLSFEKGRRLGVREAVQALLAHWQPAVRPYNEPAPVEPEPAPTGADWTPEGPLLDRGDLSLTLGYPLEKGPARGEIRAKLGEMGHILIGGAPRSGKSVLVRALLYQLLLSNFERSDGGATVFVGGIDLTGITLNPNLFDDALPQLFAPIATTKESAAWLLDRIEVDAAGREERFRAVPSLPEKLSEYIEATGDQLPYVVIFVEEFGALSILMGKEWQARFTSLVWRVAKYGFHFVCLSQDLTKATVGASRDAFMTRIWFRELPAVTRQMLGFRETAGVTANVPGRAWLKLADHEREFQGLWVPKQKLIEVVNLLKEREH